MVFLLSFVIFALSCDKGSGYQLNEPKDSVQTVVPPPKSDDPEEDPVEGPIVVVGNGEGQALVIDGSQADFACHTTIFIKGGNYSSISIRNIKKASGCPIKITNEGKVTLAGSSEMKLSNLSNVTVTGDSKNGVEKGFSFINNNYRAIILEGHISNTTLSNMEFNNIGDYVISYNNQVSYDGGENTVSEKLRFLKMDCENSGPFINFSGSKNGRNITGFYRELEIAYLNYRNSPAPGIIVYIPNAEQFNIHHNTITNVNTQNNDHNAIFQIHGNGQFHNNYVADHQGNAIRSRPFTFGNSPKEVLIYNNMIVNSRKYSAFEVQTFDEDYIQNVTTFANIKVFHNTCGNLNLSRDWYGVILDAYNISGGTCEVFNNLAFSMPAPHPKSPIVSYMAINEDDLIETNNLYFENAQAAGISNEKELRLNNQSAAKGKGIKTGYQFTDFYGVSRNLDHPSVGAVE